MPASAVPVYSAIYNPAQPAYDTDFHVDSTYEAGYLPAAQYGTARTAVIHALPVHQPHAGGAAPTITVADVPAAVPWWVRAARDLPSD